MRKFLTRTLAASALLGLVTNAAAQSFTFINPNGTGGYTEMTPGAAHPFTFVNPNGSGGYTALTPGAPHPFTFVNPNGSGGYTIFTPGQSFAPQPRPPLAVPSDGDYDN